MFQDYYKDDFYKGSSIGFQPIYKAKGTGRDSYIERNNGGFSIMHEPLTQMKPGKFLPTV